VLPFPQVGDGEGRGYNVNIPWSDVAAGDSEYMQAFNEVVMPIAAAYGPQLVFISAGFDAARGDPLGGCDVTPAGFAHMTHRLLALAGGRCVVVLEGGYNLRAQAQGMEAVVRVLQGEAPAPLLPTLPTAHASTRRGAEAAAAAAAAGATVARAGGSGSAAGGAAPAAAARCCGHAHGLPTPGAGTAAAPAAAPSGVASAPFSPTPLAPRPDPTLLPRAHYGVTTAAEAAALAAETDGLTREQALGTAVPLPAATAVLCDVMRIQATFWPSLRSKYQRLLAHAIAQAAAAGGGGAGAGFAPFGPRGIATGEEEEEGSSDEGEGGTAGRGSDSGSESGGSSSEGSGSSGDDDTMQSAGDGASSADHSSASGAAVDTGALPSPPPVKRARTLE
jgi:hypothetical protein